MATDQPYLWRSARSRGYRPPLTEGQQAGQQASMAAQGRAPVITRGRISGYASRPGAPIAANDTMHNLGIAGDIGTQEHGNAWRSFFGPLNRSSVHPVAPVPGAMPPSAGAGSSSEDAQAFSGITPPQSDFAPLPGSPEEDAQAMVPTTPDASVAAAVDGHTNWLRQNNIPVPSPASPNPSAGGYTVTTSDEVNSIRNRYTQNVATTDWGAPLPAI